MTDELTFPVELDEWVEFSTYEITVGHNAREERLTVTDSGWAKIGEQLIYSAPRHSREGKHIRVKCSIAHWDVPLDKWQAFVDRVPVRIDGRSRSTIEMTPQLVQMARDVIAYRREAPTDEQWAKETGVALKEQTVTDIIKTFNYDELDELTRTFVRERTASIRGLMRKTAEDIVTIGGHLLEVKERLPHGQFGTWLDQEFGWSERSAQNFMRVAERFKSANFAEMDVAPSALYLLAAPSTPDEAVEEAMTRAVEGEIISHREAKKIVKEHKPQSDPEPVAEPQKSPFPFEHGDRVVIEETGEVVEVRAVVPVPGTTSHKVMVRHDGEGDATSWHAEDELRKVEAVEAEDVSPAEPEAEAKPWPPIWLEQYEKAWRESKPREYILARVGGVLIAMRGMAMAIADDLGAETGTITLHPPAGGIDPVASIKVWQGDLDKLPRIYGRYYTVIGLAGASELKMLADQQLETLDVGALLAAKEARKRATPGDDVSPAEPQMTAPAAVENATRAVASKLGAGLPAPKPSGDGLPDWVADETPDIKPQGEYVTLFALVKQLEAVEQRIALIAEQAKDPIEKAVYSLIPEQLGFWSLHALVATLDGLNRAGVWDDVRNRLKDVDLDDEREVRRALRPVFQKLHTQLRQVS